MKEVTQVLWLVSDERLMEKLKKQMKLRRVPNQNIHSFVMLDDFLVNQSKANVISELKTPVSLRNYYETILGTTPVTIAEQQLNYSAQMTYFRPAKKY